MNMKRMRGRGGHRHGGGGQQGGGGGGFRQSGQQPMNRNHVFDSSGPDMRMRGTAQQLFEKYLQLGRDATGSGDHVMAESYFQHAEHYFRILNAMTQAQQQNQPGERQGGDRQNAERQNGERNGDRRRWQNNAGPDDQGHGGEPGEGEEQGLNGHSDSDDASDEPRHPIQ